MTRSKPARSAPASPGGKGAQWCSSHNEVTAVTRSMSWLIPLIMTQARRRSTCFYLVPGDPTSAWPGPTVALTSALLVGQPDPAPHHTHWFKLSADGFWKGTHPPIHPPPGCLSPISETAQCSINLHNQTRPPELAGQSASTSAYCADSVSRHSQRPAQPNFTTPGQRHDDCPSSLTGESGQSVKLHVAQPTCAAPDPPTTPCVVRGFAPTFQ